MSALITARIDDSDKKAFDEFCKSVGMNASTAINMFIKATLRDNKIPFDIGYNPFYNAKNQTLLQKNIHEMDCNVKGDEPRVWTAKSEMK